jgi:hypothetical protein
MRRTFIIIVAMAAIVVPGCRVEKTGEDTYQVQTPTPEAREAAQDASTAMSTATAELKEEAKDAAAATETAVREGVRQTGTALEKAGKEMQKKSKPGDQ